MVLFGLLNFAAQFPYPAHGQVAQPQSENYSLLRADLLRLRSGFAQKLSDAKTESERAKILELARRRIFEELVARIFPAWYGTAWDFNGTSETPRRGKIACGYFVSTTLRDLGINLNRYRIAQLYSHDIVRRLAVKTQTFSSVSATLEAIGREPGEALYVVGLDQHVGFLVRLASGELRFVHSSYGTPSEVISEVAKDSEIFSQSKKFVLGRLDEPRGLVEKWLMNSRI
jgi:hypothetical protein